MPDGRWLADDAALPINAVLAAAASTLAVALAACLWHHQHRPDGPLASQPPTTQQQQQQQQQQSSSVPVPVAEEKDHKSTRSKERRRRGKNPFRDLFKGGKKSKALLKAIKANHDHSPDTLSSSSIPTNDATSSTSRSQSPEPSSDLPDTDVFAPLDVESDGSVRSTTPNGISSSTSAADMSDRDAGQTDSICTPSSPPDPLTREPNVSSASTMAGDASKDTLSSPPVSADPRTPPSRDPQAGSCASLVRARTKWRLSRMDPNARPALLLSSLPDSVASPILSHSSTWAPVPPSGLCPDDSSRHAADGAGPSTPTNSREPTPPQSLSAPADPDQPLDQSAAIELASMRSALEAAHLREEHSRMQAEQASKERDDLRWRWNEDASLWRRREAELQAQIHHLMQQLHAYAAVASFQAQQASSNFSSPTSPHPHPSPLMQHHPVVSFPTPPVFQAQNSVSAPAHVQAMLAATPMPTSHPPGYSASPVMGVGMSPLLWSGLGLCAPNRDARHRGRRTPDSSASGSSSRGRRRRQRAGGAKSASDESSLGDWDDGSGDEGAWEEEEDIFRNNALADAILKRPESIRELSGAGKRSGGRPPVQANGVGERMDPLKDPTLEKASLALPLVDAPLE